MQSESCVKRLTGFFGRTPIRQIDPAAIEAYRRKRLESVAEVTINRECTVLSSVLSLAVSDGLLEHNPYRRVKRFRETSRRDVYLSAEEYRRLRNAARGSCRLFVVLGFHTGMRTSEMLRLLWRDVSLEKRELYLDETKAGRPRTVLLNAAACAALADHPRSSKWVFPGQAGPLNYSTILEAFGAAVLRAGLPSRGRRRITPHTLRHSHITHMLTRGADLRSVMEQVGISSLRIMQRYSHAVREAQRAYVDRLADAED